MLPILFNSPTHRRTEGRAPVWGSEFTSKDAALQGGDPTETAARLNVKLWTSVTGCGASELFGNFWLTIQNTGNRHVSNAFDLLSVFISFPLARAVAAVAAADFCCCCCCAPRPHPAPFCWGREVPKKQIACSVGGGFWTLVAGKSMKNYDAASC